MHARFFLEAFRYASQNLGADTIMLGVHWRTDYRARPGIDYDLAAHDDQTRCLRGSREPGFRTRYNSPASRQLLIRQRVHGFAIQTLGTALDDLDVFLVACLSFQAREVSHSGAIQADQQFLG